MRPRLRSRIGALLLSSAARGTTRVQRARRGLVAAASVILVVLFLRIRITSFEFSGIEVGLTEDWRFLFVLLVVDVYFLVHYYAVTLAEALGHPLPARQATLAIGEVTAAPVQEPHEHDVPLARFFDHCDALVPFVLGYLAAAWLIVAMLVP